MHTQSRKRRQGGQPVRLVSYNNVGDNFKLEQVENGKYWKMDINFEYTGVETPQKNHLEELVSTMLGARGRTLIYQTNVTTNIMYRVYKDAYRTATIIDGLTVIDIYGKQATRYEKCFGSNPEFEA